MQSKEKSNCSICLLGSFILIAIGAVMCYILFGIIFLVQDYSIWNDCEDSNLWPYVLVSIITCLLRNNFKDTKDIESLNLVCLLLIELGLGIWGSIELSAKCESCPTLRSSNLWKFGLATCILQFSIIFIAIIIICILSKINNKSIDISSKTQVISI